MLLQSFSNIQGSFYVPTNQQSFLKGFLTTNLLILN